MRRLAPETPENEVIPGARRAPRNQPAFLEAPSTPGKPQHKPCIECEGSQERFRALICFGIPTPIDVWKLAFPAV